MMRRFPLPSISDLLSTTFVLLALAITTRAQTFTTIDPPNSTMTVAVTINLHGQIAGYYTDGSTFPSPTQKGFLRERDGAYTTFEVDTSAAHFPTVVTDMNREGEIIGYVLSFPGGFPGFLRHKDGTIVQFSGTPTTAMTTAAPMMEPIPRTCTPGNNCVDGTGPIAINARGEITGAFGQGVYFGFLRRRNGSTINFNVAQGGLPETFPQAINFFGQVAGYYRDSGNVAHAFLRQPNGTVIDFDPTNSTLTVPQSINLFSETAGYYKDANTVVHAFVRKPNGKIVTFDPPGSTGTEAVSINLESEITGFYLTADGKSHGFLRRANGGIEIFDAPGAGSVGTFPKEINDRGEIVGYYEDGNSILHGFVRSRR